MQNVSYAYKQRELNEKGEKTGKALGKHVINLYCTGISRMVKIRDVHKLRQDIENDPIIKDRMADLCYLLCYILVFVYTINNLDLGNENEGYQSDLKKASIQNVLCILTTRRLK